MIELAALIICLVLALVFVFFCSSVCVRIVMSSAAYRKRLSGSSSFCQRPYSSDCMRPAYCRVYVCWRCTSTSKHLSGGCKFLIQYVQRLEESTWLIQFFHSFKFNFCNAE